MDTKKERIAERASVKSHYPLHTRTRARLEERYSSICLRRRPVDPNVVC